MKKILLAAITIILVSVVIFRAPVAAQQQQATDSHKWNYAQFSVTNGIDDGWVWSSSETTVRAKSWEDFGTKYPKPFKLGSNYLTGCLNAFGADGWELCDHTDTSSQHFGSETWVFKQPLR